MEWEDKSKSIKVLSYDDCVITSKMLNKRKIILHVERKSDKSEGNVFVRLHEKFEKEFMTFKKLLASKSIMGKSINEFKEMEVEEL